MTLLERSPGFRRLLLANIVSMLGDWLTYVAVGVLALGPSGSGLTEVALVQVAHTLPQVLGAPLAGWLADRVDRRRLITVASCARGLVTLAMALAAWRGALGALEVLLFVRMAGAAFVAVPSAALLPRLVPADEIVEANALLGSAWAIVFTIGVLLGGVVTALVGPVFALAIDATTFVIAGLLVTRLELRPFVPETRVVLRSLAADARAHPERAGAAALKVPTQLVSGAAFVAMHGVVVLMAPDRAALALGALHALRGLASGAAPWLARRIDSGRMAALGSLLAAVGTCVLALAEGPGTLALGVALWGGGVGASWVSGSATLARVVPEGLLGRYSALDAMLSATASAVGGAVFVGLVPTLDVSIALGVLAAVALAIAALVHPRRRLHVSPVIGAAVTLASMLALALPRASAQAHDRAWLEAELDARAVTDDAFVQSELYSWTTSAQVERLAAGGPLLSSGPGDGRSRSPYQRALDALAEGPDASSDDARLARLLTSDPSLAHRRYAWTTPYGAVLPRGGHSYGSALVRIDLDPEAVRVRFAPDESPAFRAVDGSGAQVPISTILASPSRLAGVLHVRASDRQGAFRELVIHGSVRSWSIGTPRTAARISDDRRVLAALRRALVGLPRGVVLPLAPSWRARASGHGLASRFGPTMPFDTPRHRPSDGALANLAAALSERARHRQPVVERVEPTSP